MRILFWGTPDFAVPPLRALLGEGFEVVGVVTQPDKAQGRSRSSVVPPPVKRVALEEGIAAVLQPERPRGPEFVDQLRALAPDLSVVVAYGHILPKEVIDLPPLGTLNIHASLLPQLRGAAPIQAAIRQGLSETGVTIMRMVPALDAGPIVLAAPTPIADDETYGELQLRLSELGALALVEALALMSVGAGRDTPQDDAHATYAPKIAREDARVRWAQGADDVARTIRAYDPRPGAFTTLHGAEVKLFGARIVQDLSPDAAAVATMAGTIAPGTVLAVGQGMLVATGDAGRAVRIVEVQPAGKKRLSVAEWSRGRGVAVGDRLGA
jgi:methionyl-tRNA formyltransferase